MHTLEMLLDDTSKSYYTFDQVSQVAKESKIDSDEEVKLMLGFFHELDMLIYLDRSEALREIIVKHNHNGCWIVLQNY